MKKEPKFLSEEYLIQNLKEWLKQIRKQGHKVYSQGSTSGKADECTFRICTKEKQHD